MPILWSVPALAFVAALALMVRQLRVNVTPELEAMTVVPAAPEPPSPEAAQPETPPPWWAPALETAHQEHEARDTETGDPAGSAGSVEFGTDPTEVALWQEKLETLARQFRIRELTLLVSRRPHGSKGDINPRIVVDFEPGATVRYSVYFMLRQELAAILGCDTDIVCKRAGAALPPVERWMVRHQLYAA